MGSGGSAARSRPRAVAMMLASAMVLIPLLAGPQARAAAQGSVLVGYPSASCAAVPACAAWLYSGCRNEFAIKDNGIGGSIVGIAADAGKSRTLKASVAVSQPPGNSGGTVYLHFYTSSCGYIKNLQLNVLTKPHTITVPSNARWMVVVPTATVLADYRWTLN